MTKPTAFKATYADFKLIKTRGVVQVVLEVPLAESDMAYQVLGGMPNPAKETWFGIAAIKNGASALAPRGAVDDLCDSGVAASRHRKAVAPDKKLAQQAGICCGDPVFQRFLWSDYNNRPRTEEEAAEYVRSYCQVKSRAEIVPGTDAGARWHFLYGNYRSWRDNPDLVEERA